MDIFFADFFCVVNLSEKHGIWMGIWTIYKKSKSVFVAKRFLSPANKIAILNIVREQGFSPAGNCLPAVSLQIFVNFFVNDKTCLTLYVICKFSLLTKSLSKIFNIFLNKYYPNIA